MPDRSTGIIFSSKRPKIRSCLLVGLQLPAAASGVAPPEQISRFKEATRANAVRSLALTAELFKIMEVFRSQEILAIPYKGPVLAAQAYGNVALREYEDLDIVLHQRDMPKANEIMVGLGYRAKFPWVLSPDSAPVRCPRRI